MADLLLVVLIGFVTGVVAAFLVTADSLKRKRIEDTANFKAFSIETVSAAVGSLFMGTLASLAIAVVCAAVFFDSPSAFTTMGYVLVALVGAVSSLLSSVITIAAAVHAPESLVQEDDEDETEEQQPAKN